MPGSRCSRRVDITSAADTLGPVRSSRQEFPGSQGGRGGRGVRGDRGGCGHHGGAGSHRPGRPGSLDRPRGLRRAGRAPRQGDWRLRGPRARGIGEPVETAEAEGVAEGREVAGCAPLAPQTRARRPRAGRSATPTVPIMAGHAASSLAGRPRAPALTSPRETPGQRWVPEASGGVLRRIWVRAPDTPPQAQGDPEQWGGGDTAAACPPYSRPHTRPS